jgi:twitching motility two-component system response regulator PilG
VRTCSCPARNAEDDDAGVWGKTTAPSSAHIRTHKTRSAVATYRPHVPRRKNLQSSSNCRARPRQQPRSSCRVFLGDILTDQATNALKVLVIDDSNTIRRSAEMFLRQAGFDVVLAEDGFDALAKISDHQPRVIFVDIMMPRLDGYQTCALIKQNPHYRSTPVIMLSSKDGVFDRARGRLAGSDCYLTKPFTKEGLVQAVKEFAQAT